MKAYILIASRHVGAEIVQNNRFCYIDEFGILLEWGFHYIVIETLFMQSLYYLK